MGGTLKPIPPKPFTARSLVGMTEGAKKRAARRDATNSNEDGRFISRRPLVRRTYLEQWPICIEKTPEETRRRYREARERHCIGERLRPCPGCNQCGPSIEVERLVCKTCGSDNIGYTTNLGNLPTIAICAMGVELTGEPGAEQCNQCDGFDIETEGTMITKLYTFSICDGTGVLPARKGRR